MHEQNVVIRDAKQEFLLSPVIIGASKISGIFKDFYVSLLDNLNFIIFIWPPKPNSIFIQYEVFSKSICFQ